MPRDYDNITSPGNMIDGTVFLTSILVSLKIGGKRLLRVMLRHASLSETITNKQTNKLATRPPK